MKNKLAICLVVALLCFTSCVKNYQPQATDLISQAQNEFNNTIGADTSKQAPLWKYAYTKTVDGKDYVKMPLKLTAPIFYQLENGEKYSADIVTSLVMVRDNKGQWDYLVVTKIPDSDFMDALQTDNKPAFSGFTKVTGWQGKFIRSAFIPSATAKASRAATVCVTVTYLTCAYGVNHPELIYCKETGSETTCNGSMGVPEDMNPDENKDPEGTGGGSTAPVVRRTGKLCGTYTWTELGVNGYYAQIDVVGFQLININGQLINIEYPSICVQLPFSAVGGQRLASSFFNESWDYGIDEAKKRINAGSMVQIDVRRYMIEDIEYYLKNHFNLASKQFTIKPEGCGKGVKPSVPTYCD